MALITANKFPPRVTQPPLDESITEDPKVLFKYLKEQQTMIDKLTAKLSAVLTSQQMVGTLSQRPSAGDAGRFFRATDNSHLYFDDGTSWQTIV